MRFASQLYLLLLVPLAALAWLELRKRSGTLRFPDASYFKTNPGLGKVWRYLVLALSLGGLFFIILALARPQKGRVFQETEGRGVDIMLCLDISGTMQAEDFSPKNRLYVAKERAKEFVARRAGDRIGLVVFSGYALTQCPLTADKTIINQLIDRVDFGMMEDGTAIGMGLAAAVNRLKDSRSKDKVIILLTDGRNNAGELDPVSAAKLAQACGVKIYCIGVGSKGPVPMPVQDPFFGKRYVQVELDLDAKTLKEIARTTGGQFFLATDAEGLKLVYDEIDKMEPVTYKVREHTVYQEKAKNFMLPALALLAASWLLSAVLLKRLP
jgi:Ca-activated chloride channel family protein